MRITLASVTVNDQARARRFYTEVLGFVVKNDLPVGNLIQLHQAGGRE